MTVIESKQNVRDMRGVEYVAMTEAAGLMFVTMEQVSKARKIFWMFRPKEPIQWEPFDLQLTFRNEMQQRFEGGSCKFTLKGNITHRHYTLNIPPVERHSSVTVTKPDIRIAEPGYHAVTEIKILGKDVEQVSCKNPQGGDVTNPDHGYTFWVSTREEIYQKYAVIVAVAFSSLATILTIVNVIFTLSR